LSASAPDLLKRRVRSCFAPISAICLAVMAFWQVEQAHAQSQESPNAIFVFGGTATQGSLVGTLFTPWNIDFSDVNMLGGSYSRRLGTVNELIGGSGLGHFGDNVTVEAEIGTSRRFGGDDLSEAWTALYFRYDGLPWNDTVYTTIALSTGVNLLLEDSKFEVEAGSGQHASRLLHYLAPEITFADPANKDVELVIRLHHRSSIFGLMDDFNSGSTFVTAGIRLRF
jgi:hypothetical protein